MIFYVVLLFSALGLSALSLRFTAENQLAICKFVVLIFGGVAAIRGYVGTDTYSYHLHFQMLTEAKSIFAMLLITEPIFIVLAKLVSIVGGSSFLYVFGISVLQILLLLYVVGRVAKPGLFLLLYVSTFYVDFHFNILRASTALLFVLAALVNLRRGLIYYFPFLVAAVFSHFTAVFVLFYVLGYRLYLTRRYYFLLFFILISVFFVYFALYDIALLKYAEHVDSTVRSDFGLGLVLLLCSYSFVALLLWKKCRALVVLFLFPVIFSRILNLFFPEISHRVIVYFLPAFFVLYLDRAMFYSDRIRHLLKISFLFIAMLNLNGVFSTLSSDVNWKYDSTHSVSPYVPYSTMFGVQ